MFCLTINHNYDMKPHRANKSVVVLSNHEEHYWGLNKSYAPVLSNSSLRQLTSMDTKNCHPICQGYCKIALCNYTLLVNETVIIESPIGFNFILPNELWTLKKILYGLQRIPCHGFTN